MLRKVQRYIVIGLIGIFILLGFLKILNNLNGREDTSNVGEEPVNIEDESANEVEDYPSNINGEMVYHTYTSYSAGDSKIYLFNFETKENICLSDKFNGVYNAMNADFNNDGTKIVFMGMADDQGKSEWDIFTYDLTTGELINLTEGNGLSDEDPKYSPDGKKIIFKQSHFSQDLNKNVYDIKEMNLNTKELKAVTNDVEEDSMPYYSSDGKSVYYSRKAGTEDSKIYKVDLDNINDITNIYSSSDISCDYPTIYNNTLYFTKDYSVDDQSDVIVRMDLSTNKTTIPEFNSSEYDCSDACAISDKYIIISSTMPDGKGGYDLYVADVETGDTWSMNLFSSEINNNKNQLGASYYIETAQ